jgi:hypothetical protein
MRMIFATTLWECSLNGMPDFFTTIQGRMFGYLQSHNIIGREHTCQFRL